MPRHYLNQCWVIVNCTLRNKFQWNFNQNTKLFIHEKASENIVCKMTAILSRGDELSAKPGRGHYLGWGLLRRFPPFRYFPNFSTSPKHMLAIEYHVHIWQVSPQLSCGDTCQIWMRFKECNRYFCQIENFAYGEIDERNFSNPHPWTNDDPIYWHL